MGLRNVIFIFFDSLFFSPKQKRFVETLYLKCQRPHRTKETYLQVLPGKRGDSFPCSWGDFDTTAVRECADQRFWTTDMIAGDIKLTWGEVKPEAYPTANDVKPTSIHFTQVVHTTSAQAIKKMWDQGKFHFKGNEGKGTNLKLVFFSTVPDPQSA